MFYSVALWTLRFLTRSKISVLTALASDIDSANVHAIDTKMPLSDLEFSLTLQYELILPGAIASNDRTRASVLLFFFKNQMARLKVYPVYDK